MKRLALVLGSLAVVALLVGLILMLRSDPAPAPVPAPDPAPRPTPPAPPARGETQPSRPVPLPPVGEPTPSGRLITRPAPASPVASVTIADIRQVVEPAVRACARDAQVPSPPVRVFVHARLKAEGGRVSAHDVTVEGAEPLGADVPACIARAYQELQTDMLPEQKDGEDLVHMPWSLP